MRFITLFVVLNVFLCHAGVCSTLNGLFTEEESTVSHCHGISNTVDVGTDSSLASDIKIKLSQDGSLSNCCLLSLINSKDLDNNFQYTLTLIDNNSFFEKFTLPKIKANITFFEIGHSPPDLIVQKSSFLI